MATILIIDDDPTTLGLLRTRLEKAGHKIKVAMDGQEGLRTAERERPDLVILDVRMPKVDGWQACRTLKSNPITSQCPVILLTGCSQDAQELYGLQCGADAYITKPWDAKELMAITTKLLSQSIADKDTASNVSQKRIKQYIQRVVKVAGSLPKSPNTEMMAAQLMRLATSLIANYQAALEEPSVSEARVKMGSVEPLCGELLYWLGLLGDSKTCENPDLPLLMAEGKILRDMFPSANKKPSKK